MKILKSNLSRRKIALSQYISLFSSSYFFPVWLHRVDIWKRLSVFFHCQQVKIHLKACKMHIISVLVTINSDTIMFRWNQMNGIPNFLLLNATFVLLCDIKAESRIFLTVYFWLRQKKCVESDFVCDIYVCRTVCFFLLIFSFSFHTFCTVCRYFLSCYVCMSKFSTIFSIYLFTSNQERWRQSHQHIDNRRNERDYFIVKLLHQMPYRKAFTSIKSRCHLNTVYHFRNSINFGIQNSIIFGVFSIKPFDFHNFINRMQWNQSWLSKLNYKLGFVGPYNGTLWAQIRHKDKTCYVYVLEMLCVYENGYKLT